METESPSAVALRDAIERIGSQRKLSFLIGVTQQSISRWVLKGMSLPAEHVLKVEAATGISRSLLRPDIYPADLASFPPGETTAPGVSAPRRRIKRAAPGGVPCPGADAHDHESSSRGLGEMPAGAASTPAGVPDSVCGAR